MTSLPPIWTATSTSRSAIGSFDQAGRPDTVWKLSVGAQPPHVGLVWIERGGDHVEDSEPAQHLEHVLQADPPVSALEPSESVARDSGAVRELGLGQAAQLSPPRNVLGNKAACAANRRWDGPGGLR